MEQLVNFMFDDKFKNGLFGIDLGQQFYVNKSGVNHWIFPYFTT